MRLFYLFLKKIQIPVKLFTLDLQTQSSLAADCCWLLPNYLQAQEFSPLRSWMPQSED